MRVLSFDPWWKQGQRKHKEDLERVKAEKEEDENDEEESDKRFSISDLPLMTISLLMANIVVYAYYPVSDPSTPALQWAFVPNDILRVDKLPTLVTHMFLNTNMILFFLNMIGLAEFGSLLERKVRWHKFIALYLVSGVFGALFPTIFNIGSTIPYFGATGPVFGVLVSYGLLFPDEIVYVRFNFRFLKFPAILGVLYMCSFVAILALLPIIPNLWFLACIGGALAGLFMTAVLFPRQAGSVLTELAGAMVPHVTERDSGCQD